jgi:TonB-linked SusC/RagA family outer membrane protein
MQKLPEKKYCIESSKTKSFKIMKKKLMYVCRRNPVAQKILLTMRLTLFLMVLSVFSAYSISYAQKTKLNLKVQNTQVKEVLNEIENQSEFFFMYDNKQVDVERKVNMEVNAQNIDQVLQKLFEGTDVNFRIVNRQILLFPENTNSVFSQQSKKITGKVTDSSGASLPGVSVIVKGTTNGTITDGDGKYSLSNIPENATLQFSFVGMKMQEIVVGGKTTINVTLAEDAIGIEEVVTVGYGTQKKTSVTSSVSTLKAKEIASIPIANLSNSIGGRVSGIIVKQSNGEPGNDGSNIYIRGISSTGATQPLIIVDDIPRNFTQLDPNTIESFTVLKDAAAVAPYGVAGANGVILVTTKRGKTGDPSLKYNGYIGFQNPTILPDYVNAYQYATLQNVAAQNAGIPLPFSDYTLQKFKDGSDPDAFPDPNYKDLLARNAVLTNHNIELSGGTEKVKYYASLGYQFQDGMWSKSIPFLKKKTNNERYNLAINLNVQATRMTKISFNVNGRVQNVTTPSLDQGRIFEEFAWDHTGYGTNFFSNGMNASYLTAALVNDGYRKVNTMALYSQLSIEQDLPFIPGLKAKGTIAYDPTTVMNKLWLTPLHRAVIDTTQRPYVITDEIYQQTRSSLDQSFNQSYQLTFQASLDYVKSFGNNNISALALFETKSNNYMSLQAFRRNYDLDIDEISMGSSSQADMTNGGTSSDSRQVGLVYRVNYGYANKYLFEASGRYDGSYYFAPESRFGFFPAFSVGWRLSEEKFIKKVDWIDNLKIRASYGEVGALAGSPFQYLSTYDIYGPSYVLGGQAVQGTSERNESNPNITWERAKKYDIGLDASFWKGLLSMEADYFYEKRSNMLVQPNVVVPAEYGIGLTQENGGNMKNQGIDFSIGSTYSISKDFQVSIAGNFTYARNALLKVFETPVTYNNPNRRRTGKPLGTPFGFHALGFFQLSDFNTDGTLKQGIAIQPWGDVQPGDVRYEDMNGDGKINDDDQTVIGNPATPQIAYGISPNIRYKGFTLDLLFQGVAKTDIYMGGWLSGAFEEGRSAYVDNFNYWTPENPNAKYPRMTSVQTVNNTQRSSFWMRNVSYLRLKSATLAYAIPSLITDKIKIQNAKIYVSGQNILTWTSMVNYDPESGVYPNLYPQQKLISIGLNITF